SEGVSTRWYPGAPLARIASMTRGSIEGGSSARLTASTPSAHAPSAGAAIPFHETPRPANSESSPMAASAAIAKEETKTKRLYEKYRSHGVLHSSSSPGTASS